MPKVSRPPISSGGRTRPPRCRRDAAGPRTTSPAGPAPTTATRRPVSTTAERSGRQPWRNASSVIERSMLPIVTAPKPSFQRAGAFAQAILRTDAAADFRQRIGLVHQRGRLEQTSILHQLQPVRNVVVHRAGAFAIRIAAIEAALGLAHRRGRREVAVDLAVAEHADRHRHFARRRARKLRNWNSLVAHAARRNSSASAARLAAFGLTSQKLAAAVRGNRRADGAPRRCR